MNNKALTASRPAMVMSTLQSLTLVRLHPVHGDAARLGGAVRAITESPWNRHPTLLVAFPHN